MTFIMRDKTSLNDSQTIRFDSDSMELSSEVNGSRQDRFPLHGKAMPSSPSCDIFWSKSIANTHHGKEEDASEGNPSILVGLDTNNSQHEEASSCWKASLNGLVPSSCSSNDSRSTASRETRP